ncbi:hypothetical protein [Luteolibacter rhizosphaerae]|uniref:hypothetical protein n=1 Tax=Luteolibacter rhizosphaerae TaxID=2989719 RepID=UPI002223251A|nr:hypothetical protein [Luteolibacter rhizosphaerae]
MNGYKSIAAATGVAAILGVAAYFSLNRQGSESPSKGGGISSVSPTENVVPANPAQTKRTRKRLDNPSPAEAEKELRRLAGSAAYDGDFDNVQVLHEIRRLKRLVNALDLEAVRRLREDSSLLEKSGMKGEGFSEAKAILSLLDRRYGLLAPEEVLTKELYQSFQSQTEKSRRYGEMLEGVAQSDPVASLRFWKKHLKGRSGEEQELLSPGNNILTLIRGATEGDSSGTWDMIQQLECEVPRSHLELNYFRALPAGTNWEEVREHLAQSESGILKDGTLSLAASAFVSSWAKHDPTAAISWLDQIHKSLPGSEIKSDSGHPSLSSGYAAALHPWMIEDPEASLRWLKEWQPAHFGKSEIVQEMIQEGVGPLEKDLLAMIEDANEVQEIVLSLAERARYRERIDQLLELDAVSEQTREQLRSRREQIAP